ncbi:hypothetical protein EV129_10975 [Rhizobium azibense]|uniref:Uncharacterized protein n=1 Tax=Rhizobium azibense TaxID=1136135 RepID=A0A4R3RIF2_9HYPH|nr:hypothetical protein EV129_10975 [Rhizobium azibense]
MGNVKTCLTVQINYVFLQNTAAGATRWIYRKHGRANQFFELLKFDN